MRGLSQDEALILHWSDQDVDVDLDDAGCERLEWELVKRGLLNWNSDDENFYFSITASGRLALRIHHRITEPT